LPPGELLAEQMPRQFAAPSHRFIRDVAGALFPEIINFVGYQPLVSAASDYVRLLGPLGEVTAWETEYVQPLAPVGEGHPVRAFTQSTAMRPIAEALTPAQMQDFKAAYDKALEAAYPAAADGSVLFPFRRVFFILKV
jgi:trans-aconitate 2-methyltransferase